MAEPVTSGAVVRGMGVAMDRTHSGTGTRVQGTGGDRSPPRRRSLAVASAATLVLLTACSGSTPAADPCQALPEGQAPAVDTELVGPFTSFVRHEGTPEDDARTVDLFACAGTERPPAELRALYAGLFTDAVAGQDDGRSASLAGRYILLVESIESWPDGLDATTVLHGTAADLLAGAGGPSAAALAADSGERAENDVDPTVAEAITDVVADARQQQLHTLFALTSFLGATESSRAREVVAVITDDYDGDVGHFVADESRAGADHQAVAVRLLELRQVINWEATP